MSSFPTAPTSTTGSSASSPSRPDTIQVIACGALAAHVREIAGRRSWPVAVHALPAALHNQPRQIVRESQRLVLRLLGDGHRVALAYADCGTYGALDRLCAEYGIARLPGLHCYELYAGHSRLMSLFDREPGTYVLTDFLLRGFDRLVLRSLGLDRHPELWPDYFGHYRRLVWLAQQPDADLQERAARVAALFGLPLTRVDVGVSRLERELEKLMVTT